MSAAGRFQVVSSDDPRYVVGDSYGVVLNGDHSYNEIQVEAPAVGSFPTVDDPEPLETPPESAPVDQSTAPTPGA